MTTPLTEETEVSHPEGGYAVALRVRGRLCVVVGGGPIGERKTRELYEQGAHVRVVAPTLTEGLRIMASSNVIEYRAAVFSPEDLQEAFLIVAATNERQVNTQVLKAARERGILSNGAGNVSDDVVGDFETMATVQRGALQIAVTTNGASPALAIRIKNQIAEMWGPEWAGWVTLLSRMRREAKRRIPDAAFRADFLRRLASRDDLRERLMQGDTAAIKQAEQMLSEAVATPLEGEALCPVR